jgi:hypothetical protein
LSIEILFSIIFGGGKVGALFNCNRRGNGKKREKTREWREKKEKKRKTGQFQLYLQYGVTKARSGGEEGGEMENRQF